MFLFSLSLVSMGHLIFLSVFFSFSINEGIQCVLFMYSLAMILVLFLYHGPHVVLLHTFCLLCHHSYYVVLLSPALILPDFTGWLENPFVDSNPQKTLFTIHQAPLKIPCALFISTWLHPKAQISPDSSINSPQIWSQWSSLFHIYTLTNIDLITCDS